MSNPKQRVLSTQEENVLEWLVDRARSAPVELSESELEAVSGGQDLAGALGFDPEADGITVSWSLSF